MSEDEKISCTDIIGSETRAAAVTTQTKHDGYAAFLDGKLQFHTIRDSKFMARTVTVFAAQTWPGVPRDLSWATLKKQYKKRLSVRPVTITEVKDDE